MNDIYFAENYTEVLDIIHNLPVVKVAIGSGEDVLPEYGLLFPDHYHELEHHDTL